MNNFPIIDIVICVHNALDDVKKCIASVKASDYPMDRLNLILVDDGSDSETYNYLLKIAEADRAWLIKHDQAKGYTKAANAGMRGRKNGYYVVLLNSDTIVPRKWIIKMYGYFKARPDLGIVGPLSNAASWQTVPEVINKEGTWAVNELPSGWNVDDMDNLLDSKWQAHSVFPRVPLLNGFCLMIKHDVIEQIGYLDEASFPRGYGEEDDFCFRAADAGFGLMVATNTYVYHAKSKSYGKKERDKLAKKGGNALKCKYSGDRIERSVQSLRQNISLDEVRNSLMEELRQKIID